MWDSPVKMTWSEPDFIQTETQKIAKDITKQHEDYIMYTINQTMGYEVDKDELIKAMQYDRDQYDKGYQDGYLDGVRDGKQIMFNKLQEFVEGSDTNDNS
jgi:flagellar biosynthesis/type III secretory pathway protein FliH